MTGTQEFSRLADSDARQRLRECCSSEYWIDALIDGRPYASAEAACERSDAAVAAMSEAALADALAGHPRIGARAAAGSWSSQEQAGVGASGDPVRAELAAGNVAYEERFGHIYLVCATGRSGAELLALLRERLGNDPAAEWQVVAAELAKINRIRLRKLLAAEDE